MNGHVAGTTLATGAAYLLFGLGRVVRHLPRPGIGGFIAGTGWLLLLGAIGAMSGVSRSLADPGDLLTGDALVHGVPDLAFGALLVAGTRGRPATALPALLALGAALFFAVMIVSGGTPGAWREAGLLMGPFSGGGPVAPVRSGRPAAPARARHRVAGRGDGDGRA